METKAQNRKYRTEPEGDMLRIYAVRDFRHVKAGERGGLVEKESNLAHDGNAWVDCDAVVTGNAVVTAPLSTARRSDGYEFALLPMLDGCVMVSAGCRLFTFAEARKHWQATRAGTQLGDETFAILDHLERMAKIRGMVE